MLYIYLRSDMALCCEEAKAFYANIETDDVKVELVENGVETHIRESDSYEDAILKIESNRHIVIAGRDVINHLDFEKIVTIVESIKPEKLEIEMRNFEGDYIGVINRLKRITRNVIVSYVVDSGTENQQEGLNTLAELAKLRHNSHTTYVVTCCNNNLMEFVSKYAELVLPNWMSISVEYGNATHSNDVVVEASTITNLNKLKCNITSVKLREQIQNVYDVTFKYALSTRK